MKPIVILVVALLIGIAACDRRPVQEDLKLDHNSATRGRLENSPGAAESPYELQFIDTMIAHHETAIDAAQLVGTRAGHEELKKIAATIIEDQRQEIAQMRSWRSQWFRESPKTVNFDLPGMRDSMNGMDLDKLDLLKENAFDIEFIRQMILSHQGAISMAADLQSKETRVEIKALAEEIVRSRTAEIEQMRAREKQWSRK